jgi:hypothetical protein
MDELGNQIFWTLTVLIGMINIPVNSIAFLVFVKDKNLKKKPMNIFLASLAITDILMMVGVAPCYAVFCCNAEKKITLSWLLVGVKDYVFIATNLNMLAICYDRSCAVLKSLLYSVLITPVKVKLMLACIWFFPIILTAVRNGWHFNSSLNIEYVDRLYDNILLFLFVLLPLCIMVVTNIRIISVIRRQEQSISSVENLHQRLENDPGRLTPSRQINHEWIQKRNGTLSCLRVVLAYVIAWLPRIAFNVYFLFGKPEDPLLMRISLLFLFVQSTIDPFIYTYYRSDFRCALKRLFTRKSRQTDDSVQH